MNDEVSLEIPELFLSQLQAIAYVSGKTLQAALNAVLVTSLPNPEENPENLLRLAVAIVQPGDDLDAFIERFQEVRDAEKLLISDHSIIVAFERFRGLMDAEEAALLDQANALFIRQVKPENKLSREEIERIADEIQGTQEGEEWKE